MEKADFGEGYSTVFKSKKKIGGNKAVFSDNLTTINIQKALKSIIMYSIFFPN